MRKYLFITILFSCLCLGARGQDPDRWNTVKTLVDGLLENVPKATTAQSLRYWFDDNAGTEFQTSNILDGSNIEVNASALVEGIHVLHYQVIDSKGVTSIPASKLFIKISETPEAMKIRYWFDNNFSGSQAIENLNGATTINASSLVDGIHVLHYQIEDSKGKVYVPVSKMFIKAGATPTTAKLRYWFDDEKTQVVEYDYSSGVQTVDASGIVEGIHTVHYQIVDNNGTVGIPVSKMFMKLGAKTITATAIQYWFDENDAFIKESAIDLDNLTTTVDASSLGYGKHILNYQLKLSDGTLSPAATATFETTQTLRGDANNDQKVNVADIVVIQIFISDNTKPIHGANADAYRANDDDNYGDNVIDQNDVEAVKNIIIPPVE